MLVLLQVNIFTCAAPANHKPGDTLPPRMMRRFAMEATWETLEIALTFQDDYGSYSLLTSDIHMLTKTGSG